MQRQQEILDIIEKLAICFENLLGKNAKMVLNIFQDNKVIDLIEEVIKYYDESQFEKIYPKAMAEIISVKASAIRVIELARNNEVNMKKKLEFELLPLTENLRLSFYYHNWVGDNREQEEKFLKNGISYYYRNRYLEEAKRTGKYKYEISIIITGFNKVEITKQCINSLKKYLPQNITYELIYFNHGSSDGTKEYFESQKPHKQVDIEVNGGAKTVTDRIIEGKYRLMISNDILITKNCITNLYQCIDSDEKIGWVVPSTPNVSNLQSIEAKYETLDEMYLFAKRNNISNPDRWEEKPRLCNPVDISRMSTRFEVLGNIIAYLGGISFPDDMISCIFRRRGYKLILAKDAYCYHFGSMTIGEQIGNQHKARITYCKGRINFIKRFGMDPWGYGMAYDPVLMNSLEVKGIITGNVLGINSGMGANPLKIKSLLREKTKKKDLRVTYITQYNMYWEDVKGLGDKAYKVQEWIEYENVLEEKYDFILLENGIDICDINHINRLKQYLSEGGQIIVRSENESISRALEKDYDAKVIRSNGSNLWLQIEK